jgi:uncharacterized protein (TIGR04255 family)
MIRRDYPYYQRSNTLALQPGPGPLSQEATYKFTSKDQKWAISLKASSISLETSAYTKFEDFAVRLRVMLDAAEKVIDADFYTRVGLRYINGLPVEQKKLGGWISPSLAPALVDGVFGSVDQFWTEVRGRTPVGGYLLRHGFADLGAKREYVLDLDFYVDLTPCAIARKMVGTLNSDSFRLFMWCIGDQAKAAMGKATPKEGKK